MHSEPHSLPQQMLVFVLINLTFKHDAMANSDFVMYVLLGANDTQSTCNSAF